MTQTVAKQTVAASNLANLDPPGYKAKEASFADALDGERSPMSKTSAGHLSGASDTAAAAKDVEGLPARRDGNNVQLDRELLNMNRTAGDFSAAQTALSAKFRLVRYAINEGR